MGFPLWKMRVRGDFVKIFNSIGVKVFLRLTSRWSPALAKKFLPYNQVVIDLNPDLGSEIFIRTCHCEHLKGARQSRGRGWDCFVSLAMTIPKSGFGVVLLFDRPLIVFPVRYGITCTLVTEALQLLFSLVSATRIVSSGMWSERMARS